MYKQDQLKPDIDNLDNCTRILSLKYWTSQIMLYRHKKAFTAVPLTNATENSSIFQQNWTELNSFYLNSCLLFISTSSTDEERRRTQEESSTKTEKTSSLSRNCNLPTFIANDTRINLTQPKPSQEKFDLLKSRFIFHNPNRQTLQVCYFYYFSKQSSLIY